MLWRDHLPDDCPPNDAHDPSGYYYRLIGGKHPKAQDFLSHRELYPNRHFNDECDACGVSVYSDIEGIRSLLNKIPSLRKNKQVAKGKPQTDCGIVKHTPSDTHESHYTWWIPKNVDPSPMFVVIPMPKGS